MRFIRNIALLIKINAFVIGGVYSVDGDSPLSGDENTVQMFCESGFPAPVMSENRDKLSFRYFQTYSVKHPIRRNNIPVIVGISVFKGKIVYFDYIFQIMPFYSKRTIAVFPHGIASPVSRTGKAISSASTFILYCFPTVIFNRYDITDGDKPVV